MHLGSDFVGVNMQITKNNFYSPGGDSNGVILECISKSKGINDLFNEDKEGKVGTTTFQI